MVLDSETGAQAFHLLWDLFDKQLQVQLWAAGLPPARHRPAAMYEDRGQNYYKGTLSPFDCPG